MNNNPEPPCSPAHFIGAIFCLIACLFAPAAFAQGSSTGSIAGRVYNPETDSYVRDAEIQVVGTDRSIISETGGYYRFDDLPAGEVTLELRYAGAHTQRFTATIASGETTRLELTLLDEEASGQKGDIVILEKFSVSGEREGNAKAIMEQKSSITAKNILTTDTFDYVTGGNMADFLQYMPGISMESDDEDAQAARIHGLDPRYVGVTLDGSALATSSEGGVGATRRFTFDQISSNNIEAIEVSKVNSADQSADASAGNINFRSKSPLDRKRTHLKWEASINGTSKALRLDSTSGPGDGDHHKILLGGSIDYSTTTLGGKLGLLLTAGQDNRYRKTDYYVNDYVYPAVPIEVTTPGTPNMRAVTFRSDENITHRNHASLGLDFQPVPDLRISVRTQWAGTKQDQHKRSLRLYSTIGNLHTSSDHNYLRSDKGIVYLSGNSYTKDVDEFIIKPSFTYKKGPFNIDGGIMFSKSRTNVDDLKNGYPHTVSARISNTPIAMSRANTNSTAWNFVSEADIYNLENYNNTYANDVRVRPQDMREDVYDASFNVKWSAPWTIPTYFKTGARYREMKHTIEHFSEYYTFVGADGTHGTADDSFGPYQSSYNFDPDFGGNIFNSGQKIPFPDYKKVGALMGENPNYFDYDDYTSYKYWLETLSNYREKIPAFYVMGVTSIGRLSMQAGVRYERTDARAKVLSDPIGDDDMAILHPELVPETIDYLNARYQGAERYWDKRKYDDYFLSASVKYTITQNFIGRLGFHQGIFRPDMRDLSGRVTISTTDMCVTIPNPNLKSEYSNNYMAELEYYFSRVGSVSAGYFVHDIKDGIYSGATYDYQNIDKIPERFRTQEVMELITDPDDPYVFKMKENAASLLVHGFELSYRQSLTFLPGVLNRLTAFATYTRTFYDNEVFAGRIPSNAVATGLSYSDRRLKISMKGTWQDDAFYQLFEYNEIRRSEDRLFVNLDITYRLPIKRNKNSFFRYYRIFLAGRNIFDAPNLRVYTVEKGRLLTERRNGSIWTLGIEGGF